MSQKSKVQSPKSRKFRREDELYLEMLDATGKRVIAARDRYHARKRDRWMRRRKQKGRQRRLLSIEAIGWCAELVRKKPK